ncbi:SGNH hydrolase domain-containing protein [Gordonia sp. NPDC003424]
MSPPTTDRQPSSATFFDDIAGLRGIAVLLVVLFHAHVPFIDGGFIGVDVFFVISGFLITRLLVREYERRGTVSFKGFYARRARRIIPAAALVIVVSIIGAALTMPLLKVFKQAIDLLAAAAQMANWHFIAQNADYLSGSIDGSLATHFWSLSIEEQLYFVWPLTVFAAAALVSRTPLRRYLSMRMAVGIVVGLISAASLFAAVRLTSTDPSLAYMATHTRAWQFGAGALLAVVAPALVGHGRTAKLTTPLAFTLGWLGLAGLLYGAFAITPQTPYPGTAALLPTGAAVLIIAAGQMFHSTLEPVERPTATPPSAGRVAPGALAEGAYRDPQPEPASAHPPLPEQPASAASVRVEGTDPTPPDHPASPETRPSPLPEEPASASERASRRVAATRLLTTLTPTTLLALPSLRFLGRISYAWYLWHWPAIVLFEQATGISAWPALLAVSVVSFLIATASTLWFEEPIIANRELRRNTSASISVGITGLVVALAVTMTAGILTVKVASRDTVANAALTYQSVFGTDNQTTSGAVVPNPFQAYDDRPSPNECLLPVSQRTPTRSCTFGPDDGIPVVLFGDSHAEQWVESIREIGSNHNWQIHQFTKAACPAQNLPPHGMPDPYAKQDCVDWRRDSLEQIAALHPKIIIVSSLSTYVPSKAMAETAWNDTLTTLRATGARLVYIADTPYPNFQVADCMSGSLDNWSKCDFAFDDVPRFEPVLEMPAGRGKRRIVTISVNDLLCQGNTCFPARNKIMFYRDESHLTATAARVLEPALVNRLDAAGFDYRAG